MSTSFVTLVPPPGITQGDAYAQLEQASRGESTPHGPKPFIDALIVRKRVFVDEQKCRLSTEIDEDDARSFHWVIYASVAPGSVNKSTSSGGDIYGTPSYMPATRSGNAPEPRQSVSGQVPVGTIRVVPPPHGPHPAPGSVDGEGGENVAALRVEGGDRATRLHDGREAYVKLGRLATVKKYRGMGLGKLITNTALSWVAQNKDKVQALREDPVEREKIRREGREWHGLVMAHAQVTAVSFYESLGFEVDKELGEWIEEGIGHIAMWKRLEVKPSMK